MWYGDLVTMAWWDDLWLNEAFATWMAFHIVDAWKPEWKMWHDFQHHRAAALRARRARPHPPDLQRGAHAERRHRELRPHHLREGRVGRAHDRALPRREDLPRGRARLHPRAPGVERRRRRSVARARARRRGATSSRSCGRGSSSQGSRSLSLKRGALEGAARPRASRRSASAAAPRSASDAGARAARGRSPGSVASADARGRARIVRQLVSSATREGGRSRRGEPRFVYGNADEGGFFRPLHDPAELRALAENLPRARRRRAHGPRRATSGRWCAPVARALESFLDLAARARRRARPGRAARAARPARVPARIASRREAGPRRRRPRSATGSPRRFGPRSLALGWDAAARRGRRRAAAARGAPLACSASSRSDRAVLASAAARFERYLADRRDAIEPNLADAVVALGARARRRGALRRAPRRLRRARARRRSAAASCSALGEFRAPALVDRALALTAHRRRRRPRTSRSCWCACSRTARRASAPGPSSRSAGRGSAGACRRCSPRVRSRRSRCSAPARPGATSPPSSARTRCRPRRAPSKQALERFDLDAELCGARGAELRRWLGGEAAGPRKGR